MSAVKKSLEIEKLDYNKTIDTSSGNKRKIDRKKGLELAEKLRSALEEYNDAINSFSQPKKQAK